MLMAPLEGTLSKRRGGARSEGESMTRKRRTIKSRSAVVIAIAAAVLMFVASLNNASAATTSPAGTYSLFANADTGKAVLDSEVADLELGLVIVPRQAGSLEAIKFLKAPGDVNTRTVTLWSSSGTKLATANSVNETASGWQTVRLASPVNLTAGKSYVVSYHANRYMATNDYFSTARIVGPLKAPSGTNGRYAYGAKFPKASYRSSNYWVDVLYTVTDSPSTSTSTTSTTNAPSTTSAPSTTAPAPTTTLPNTGGQALNLPRIAWEGGPAYYNQFSVTKAAGWSDPSFFPIGIWYNGFSNDAEAQYDKSYGINSYAGMDEATPYSLFADNNQFWLGGKLNSTFPADGKQWAGDFLDDEVDGRFPAAEGLALIKSLVDGYGDDGRFKYANFTQIVIGAYGEPNNTNSAAYINSYEGPTSVDMYYYTVPNCNISFDYISVPSDPGHCRTASSYGKTIDAMRARDAADGKLKPMWQFVENLNGGPGEGPYYAYISPGQLKGAVMNSIVHEARGIMYFNQSFSGTCQGGGILRQSQYGGDNFCAKPQMEAMKQVNLLIKDLAPVINTQSYQWDFGANLDTMLKTYNDSAYIFSMISGDASSQPGNRTFSLPPDLANARSIEVVNEGRSIPVTNGQFTDNFAAEYTYHIYKVAM